MRIFQMLSTNRVRTQSDTKLPKMALRIVKLKAGNAVFLELAFVFL